MSSEFRKSSLDNSGHSDDENVIHSEQSTMESSPGPSSIQGNENDDDSAETSQNQDSQSQSESTNTENIFFKGLKTIFGKETEDASNLLVTFHVHLPSFDYVDGYPIVIGNIGELGNWEEPIVKLKQPRSSDYMFQSSYWYSDPISIPVNILDKVKYRYAFFQKKKNKDSKGKEEGDLYFEEGQQHRLLTTRTGSQFDIAARFRVKNRQCELRSIREFMFLDIIYDDVSSNNLGEKIIEYQELLNRFGEMGLKASNFEFIGYNLQRSRTRELEKRVFLCIVLGYYVDWRQQKSIGRLVLPNGFPTTQIIDTLEKFQPDILPEECQAALNITMTSVIYLNMANRNFDWLRLFEVASILDPNFSFIEAIQDLQYNNERMSKFLNEYMKFAKPVVDKIKDLEVYSNIGMWLFYNCRSLEALLFIWIKVIDHAKIRDNQLLKHFHLRIEQLISSSHATGLTKQFSQIPPELQSEVAGTFRMHALSLLKHRGIEWSRNNSEEILNILQDPQYKWSEDNFLEAMYHVSESLRPNLILIFPNLLEYWFKNFKPYFDPEICKTWYHHLIDINGSESSIANDPDFIFEIYDNLSFIFPIVGKHGEIFEELLDVAANRVKNCAISNILTVTPKIAKLRKEIYYSYGEMIKLMLKKSINKVDNNVIKILLQVCDCKNEVLHIQNELSENIVYHVMTYLEDKDTDIKNNPNLSAAILNLLKTYRFWSLIFNATGRVENLHSHSYIKQVQGLIYKFADDIIEKTITIRSLQEILEYEDILLDLFNFSVKNEKINMDIMKKLRMNCRSYMLKLDQLRTFYDNFCPVEKVKDVSKFLDDINNLNSNLENLALKDALAPDHWKFHQKNVHCAIRVHKIAKSHTFRNIFDNIMKVEEVDLTVANIAQTIMPSVFEEYDKLCQQYKEWEKLKCSKGSVLWKNVTDIEKELEVMKNNMEVENSERLVQTLAHLSLVPTQVERLQQLSTVAVMFKVAHTKEDWLERLLMVLRDDYLWLGRLLDFFDIFNHYLGLIDDDCWDLIKELSQAGDFIVFLHKIAEHDIKNLINGVDESSDERLIQEDTVSSLIQVKQFLLPLLKTAEKSSLEEFLDEIRAVTQQNAKLGNKVALCNNNNMALQNLYNSISNKGEVTREKISSAVKRGTYTFERDDKGDTCKVTLSYPTVKGTKQPSYTLNDLHDLRGRALLISKPSASVDIVTNQTPGVETEGEVSKPIMDEFVKQVDMAQEIINLSTKLIQTGHFSYRTFKREIQGTENMQQAVTELKAHLKEWEEIVNKAQEEHYYLTFFPARHILTFLDYFSISDKADENTEKHDNIKIHEKTEERENIKEREDTGERENIEKREDTKESEDVEIREDTEVSETAEKREDTEVSENIEKREDTEVSGNVEKREDTEVSENIEKREDTEVSENVEKREDTEVSENVEKREDTEVSDNVEKREDTEVTENVEKREDTEEREIAEGHDETIEEHEIVEEFDDTEECGGTEECEKLIRFVNSKAKLPPKDQITINLGDSYQQILGEIGSILQGIFGTIPKEQRLAENVKERVITDVVYPGKLFVAACDDKFLVPNIIMSLYVNHGCYPLPWQLLICTNSTTMEELAIFVKRCFFASNNGYEETVFCLANLELLDFELQYSLVNLIRSMREKHSNFQLALICYREQGLHHHILDQFSQDVHTTNGLSGEAMKILYHELYPNIMSVSSELSGQGKSEWIRQSSYSKKLIPKSFLISDEADFRTLVHRFKEFKIRPFESVHLNIVSADNPIDVNMFLFELLTLGIVFCNMDVAFLPNTLVYIEIASTMEQHLFKSLPIAGYLQQTHLTWNIDNLVVSQDIDSPIQVVSHYLKELGDEEAINENDIDFTDLGPLSADECRGLIKDYLFKRNTNELVEATEISSYRFIEIFVNVFADQLVRLSLSSFFQVENLKLMVEEEHIRSTLVKTLLNVSKDFATKSIATKAAQKENISIVEDETARLGTIVQWDDSNHLLVFFLSQTPDSICALYRDKEKVPQNVKTLLKSQHIGDKSLWDLDDYHTMEPNILLSTLENLARKTMYKLEYPQYALSADNLIKMALILLRARANIPVIVCGEAGCGKTSLIGFLAKVVEVEFHALNLHAGVTEEAILYFMRESQEKAKEGEVWLFFDEINTCNHIGLLADLIAHRILNGKPIHNNIRLFAACNPYRLRTKSATIAGLLKPKDPRFEEKSKLVYQVKPLPDQILDYVWDYGVLKPKEEEKYIEIMVSEQLKELGHKVLSECLFASQDFIRQIESSYSVSLRDVKRAITLVKFFIKSFEDRPPIKRFGKVKKYPEPSDITINVRCYVIALGLCYQSRIYEQHLRKEYRKRMGEILRKHKFNIDDERFSNIIREEQEDYINRMQCPPNTAKNEALLENVLVMIVCILTKIPCFIIGAPGSSKSLAVRLISQNLRGSDSNDEYFRKLPQVYLIPHQGSSSSTSEGINKVFQKAVAYQETSSEEFPVLSVVLLDEVGLAETSPFNPLKVLHSLLEPSYPAVGPTVSCIAISNWRLDNSKSSRALLVQRPKFELEDLTDTASRLLIKSENSQISIASLNLLAQSYLNYEQNGQEKLQNFHGLRDYYSLVKSLSQYSSLTPENIQMALIRNFGGVDNIRQLIEKYFGQVIRYFNSSKEFNYKHIPIGDLINANLEDKDARHLMVIGKSDSIVNLLNYQLRKKGLDPVIILGSQFPEDQDDYSYSVLSRIMMCVETGRPLILTDLEIIYGSLYDLWNQNYIVVGSEDDPKFYARVALGAYANPMLYVAPTFRCILVMDESKLEKADPPLLNRFEKQKMTMNDTLTQQENELVDTLKEWTELISTITDKKNMNMELKGFTERDLFIGFDENETLQSLVIDVKKSFPEAEDDEVLFKCKEKLVKIASSDGIIRAERSNLNLDEVKQWKNIYFNEQHHDNLTDHIQYCLSNIEDYNEGSEGLQLIINTFSNINTDIKSRLQYVTSCQIDKLSTFKTESQFQNRIKYFWNESQDKMLILQCDVTTINAGCIKLAKFLIEQYRNEYLQKKKLQSQLQEDAEQSLSWSLKNSQSKQPQKDYPTKHVCIILHIHREQENSLASFNFMCGWDQVTIETLLPQEKDLSLLLNDNLSDLITTVYPFEEILKQELLWCLLCLKFRSNFKSVEHIKMLNEKVYKNPILVNLLKTRTVNWLKENSNNNTNWQYEVSSNKKLLYPYSSFANALLAHIRRVIRNPIAKLLYALEKYAATYTIIFLYEKSITGKSPAKFTTEGVESGDTIKEISDDNIMSEDACLLEFWNKMVDDENVISIEGLKVEPSPDSYVMPHGVYELEFPFSYYIMKKIDDSRKVYEEELLSLYNDQDNIDKTTGELHTHVVEGYNKKFINNIEKSPIIKNSPIANYPEKYFKDFINVILSDKVSSGEKDGNLDERLLKFIFERRLGADNVLNPIRLHSYWWKNSSSIIAELSLAQLSPNVITQIEKENDENKTLSDVEFEIHLVEQVIRNLLGRIIDAKEGEQEGLRNLRIVERWQYEVTIVLSLCEKINVSFKLYSLQLLRICNDLLITKSIPLSDMKQIIKYAQQQNANPFDGSQNEIITEGFINVVMKVLTNLEPIEKNLIPKRLFILRCLDMLTLESPVRLYLYKEIFSSLPFPLMGAIVSRIFRTEEKECPNSILQLIQQPKQIFQRSERLATINECFNIDNLDVMMATLICDTFQQEFFSKLDLISLVDGVNSAINALHENDIQPLQRIASIAFLKEFTKQFWIYVIKRNEDYLQPITHNILEAEGFNGTALIEQFNNTMSISHPLITSFGLYLLRELRINREFSSDEIKKFCEAQSKNLNWFDNFNLDDKNESRSPFNPYWAVSEYGKLEIAFTLLYNDDNRPQFNSIFHQFNNKVPDLSNKLALFGIIVAKLHSIRASREWKYNEDQISEYFRQRITNLTTIPEDFKETLFKIMTNTHPLLKINEVISNSELLIKSVISHIIGLHVLLDPNTTPLSIYMHRIVDAQKTYVLACQSDMENLLFSAIAEREGVSRYSCQCGYKYLIGECGGAMEESKCPECKETIGGLSHVTAVGNKRIDVENKYSFESTDQKGYISEKINDDINYTMRYLTPVAYRILHLIVHAIIGSQAPSPDSIAFIQQHNQDYTDVEGYCMEHIKNDWNVLKQILNCSDENLALTFHSLVLTLNENLPACRSMLYSSSIRNQWETAFSQTTVLELTRNVNESAAKFRAQLDQNMKKVDVKNSLLEELINQTNLMDERYTRENLPSLWRTIGKIDYNSFRAYYNSDPKHAENYPFLNIFFRHSKNLHLIKYLYPMVRFIQILSTRLGYKISRDDAKNLTFRKFIENESNNGEDKVTYDILDKYFKEFQTSYNTIINKVERYQCHTFKIKPQITDQESIVYGFMEGKDEGIYLCAIIEYLINIQNNFLREMMLITPGSCDSLRFLQSPSWDIITSSADNSPYIIKTMRVDRAVESNFIVYEWNDEILQYSQRNLDVGKGQYIIFDLQRIESELANTLVYNKVHFEGGNEQLALDPFPYHLELFSSSIRILGDIKSLIPQEEIPSEKLTLIIGQQSVPSYLTLSTSLSSLASKDNSSELLSLLEILLCFIKRTSIGDGNLPLNEFINQWVQLSSLTENSRFKTILSYDLQLKHVVSLYEVIEEQVANIMIQFIYKKFKEPLTDEMKKGLDDAIDFEGGNKEKIPADSFITAMKRFIQRVLQTESDNENHPLNTYMTDMSLNLWPSNNVIEEVLDNIFPDTLLVANSFAAYEYVLMKKEILSKPKQPYSGGKPIHNFNIQTVTSSSSDATTSSSSQSTQTSTFTSKNKGKQVIRDNDDQ